MAATTIVALPGPPRELQPMVTQELVSFLSGHYGLHDVGCSLTLRFVGVGQSQIDQVLRDHVPMDQDVFVSSLFEGSRVDFTFALPGNGPTNLARLKHIETQLLEHLGDYIYADDETTLEQAVVRKLQARSGSLVVVEVGSGGHLANNLSRVEHVASLLAGAYVAASEAQLPGLLNIPETQWSAWKPGRERIQELGRWAKQKTASEWAIVVGEAESPTASGASLWVAFGLPKDRWEFQPVPFRGNNESAQANLTTQILDRMRRLLR